MAAESAESERVGEVERERLLLSPWPRLLGDSELESLVGDRDRRPLLRLSRPRAGGDGVLCALILGSAFLLGDGPRSKVGILVGFLLGGLARSGLSPHESLSPSPPCRGAATFCCFSCSRISRILLASMSDRSMSEILLMFSFLPLDFDRFLLCSLSSSLILSSIKFGLRNDVPITYCRSLASYMQAFSIVRNSTYMLGASV